VATAFATGFVHYLLDRNVFRMSDPRVRAAARGLLDPPGSRVDVSATPAVRPTSPTCNPASSS
jgi:hypothetical protein